jgi:hypothetical protein
VASLASFKQSRRKIMSKYCLSLLMGFLGAGWFFLGDAYAADGLNPCEMMQKADVETAFAPRKFDDGSLVQTTKGSAKLAAVSECIYTSKGASIKEMLSVSLLARRAPTDATGMSPAQARAGAVTLKATPVDVSGLGEGAYWVNLGTASAPSIQLNVFRSKREWLVYGVAGKIDSNTLATNLTNIAKATSSR